MTNEEKAIEIGVKYQTPCHGVGDCEFEARQSALEMALWEDEQFTTEKQTLIDKACDAYCKVCGHFSHTVPTRICRMDCHYYTDFRKLMEETTK